MVGPASRRSRAVMNRRGAGSTSMDTSAGRRSNELLPAGHCNGVLPAVEWAPVSASDGTGSVYMRVFIFFAAATAFVFAGVSPAAELPQLKFNEVKEIAPGVFFRYSSISAADKAVPFGGSNETWIVFDDY